METMRPLYLDVGGEPVFAFLHPARIGREPAVLLCPPFGREDAASYRSRREWAENLAAAGMPVLRFDLPGTGDSAGCIDDPGRLASWVEAVGAAARFVRAETESARTAAIGIGLGGMLAVAAVADGAPLDDLVLWGVPADGRALVRELTTFARIESEAIVVAGGPAPPPESSEIAPGGFLLPAAMIEALRELDLTARRLPGVEQRRRVLLLSRDGIPPDDALRTALVRSGAQVEVAEGHGFAEMMTVLPETARLPDAAAARVADWLISAPPSSWPHEPLRAAAAETAELLIHGITIRETPIAVERADVRLFGVLAEPLDVPRTDLALVLLNAGAIRRSGPGRMWVEIARRWAGRGVPTLRVDLAGIGDGSAGGVAPLTVADLYAPEYVDQVLAAVDAVAERVGARRFALLGLCAGAYWSFHAALVDDRVSLAVMLNPRLLFWSPEIRDEWDAQNRRNKLFRANAWRQIGTTPVAALPRRSLTLAARFTMDTLRAPARQRARRAAQAATASALDRLEASGTRALFAFCEGEPLREDLSSSGMVGQTERWPGVTFVDLPGRDHILRPLWMHEHMDEAVDRALTSELHRDDHAGPPAGRVPAAGVRQAE